MASIDLQAIGNIEARWGVKAGDYNVTLNSKTDMMDFQDLMVKFSKNRAVAVEGEVEPLTVRIQQRNKRLEELSEALAELTKIQTSFDSDAEGSDACGWDVAFSESTAQILRDLGYGSDGGWTGPKDGKYIINGNRLIICQSNALNEELTAAFHGAEVNPLGYWTGGTDVDTGATNRKLGSDMADSVTGGGLHGKDLSKADVSVNIYAWLKAQDTGVPVELCCAIGDETIDGRPYDEIVAIARDFINSLGGFEKFAEWGLV